MNNNKDVDFESNPRIHPANIPIGIWGIIVAGSIIFSYFFDESILARNLESILASLLGFALIITGIIGIAKEELRGMGHTTFRGDTARLISLVFIFAGIFINLILISSYFIIRIKGIF